MKSKPHLDQHDAQQILLAAEAEASRQQWSVSIAVCDDGGHLLAFWRRDGATPASAHIAAAKARTAALMCRETVGVEQMINQGRTAFLSVPELQGLLEGGVQILVDGVCVGGVGVSGVQSAQDAQVAKAGLASLGQGAAG